MLLFLILLILVAVIAWKAFVTAIGIGIVVIAVAAAVLVGIGRAVAHETDFGLKVKKLMGRYGGFYMDHPFLAYMLLLAVACGVAFLIVGPISDLVTQATKEEEETVAVEETKTFDPGITPQAIADFFDEIAEGEGVEKFGPMWAAADSTIAGRLAETNSGVDLVLIQEPNGCISRIQITARAKDAQTNQVPEEFMVYTAGAVLIFEDGNSAQKIWDKMNDGENHFVLDGAEMSLIRDSSKWECIIIPR